MSNRAIILHGLQANSDSNWFPWLKEQLEQRDYEVWAPDLPGADHPVASKWANYLLKSSWDFQGSLIIGHSAGAVAAMVLAQLLPPNIHPKAEVLVSAFNPVSTYNEYYRELKDLHDIPFDFKRIQATVDRFIFVHGNNDPWAPFADGQDLAAKTSGEFVAVPNGQHFSLALDPAYAEFPFLLDLLEQRKLV